MPAGPDELLREIYDHWNARRLGALREYFHPDVVFTDQRHMGSWNGTLDDYVAMIEGFWSLIPDAPAVRAEAVRVDAGRMVHILGTAGTDNITGGRVEFEFYVVTDGPEGRVTRVDFFDDEASAMAHYETLAP